MIFRQLFDPQSSTYTYLLADPGSREALLIDPVFEQVRRDAALIDELVLKLKWTLETHVHADHVTGAWLLREKLGSRIALSKAGGADGADKYLEPQEKISFGKRSLETRATPGHTHTHLSFIVDDGGKQAVFSGGSLLYGSVGRTDIPFADWGTLVQSIRSLVDRFPPETIVYSGHGPETTLGAELERNPFLDELRVS